MQKVSQKTKQISSWQNEKQRWRKLKKEEEESLKCTMTPKARPATTEFSTETAARSRSPTWPAKVWVSAPSEYWNTEVRIAGPANLHSFFDSKPKFLTALFTVFSSPMSEFSLCSSKGLSIHNHFFFCHWYWFQLWHPFSDIRISSEYQTNFGLAFYACVCYVCVGVRNEKMGMASEENVEVLPTAINNIKKEVRTVAKDSMEL